MVLLLGAGRGLGQSLLRFFLDRQIPVSCVTRTQASSDTLRSEVAGDRGSLLFSEAFDLADRASSDAFVERLLSRSGSAGFPVLAIYAAGFLAGRSSLFHEAMSDIDREIAVNFTIPLYWSCALSRHFMRFGKGGHLFISSGVARTMRPHWGAYGVAKGALESLAAQLSIDLPAPHYSLSINPGGMATEMRRLAYPEEDPGTLPSPEEIGRKIGRLCLLLMEGQGREYNGKRLQMGDLP